MRKFIWVAFALSVLAVSSQAQQIPAADVSAGYSYFRVGGSGGANLNGFQHIGRLQRQRLVRGSWRSGGIPRIAKRSGLDRADVHGRSTLYYPQVGQSCRQPMC